MRSFLAFLLLVSAASAQQQRIPRQSPSVTGVQGLVHNEAGLSLSGAIVTLTNTVTGERVQLVTQGDGSFRKLGIAPGEYDLQVDSHGYEPYHQQVEITAGKVFGADVKLTAMPTAPPRAPARRPELGPPNPAPTPQAEPPFREIPEEQSPGRMEPPPSPLPDDEQVFKRVPDRWKNDYPRYRRYGFSGDVPYVPGHWYDPFNRNKLKGDYPIFGRTFLNLTASSDTFFEGRLIPLPAGVSTARPLESGFFGNFGQLFTTEDVAFSFDLFHGDAAFRPVDWRVKVTVDENLNYLAVQENGIVNANPRAGTTRFDDHAGMQEAFGEVKLHDLSDSYDFVSLRAGIQGFNSDFRGFIFSDQEPGVRLFGNFDANRYQYNVAGFAMLEKDTNSGLNSFRYRHQQVYLANVYRQDFIKPGYTIQASFHYDKDDPSFELDNNGFLARPAPIGSVVNGQIFEHKIRAYYYGVTGDGHIGRLNVDHAFYQVLGHDSDNAIAGRPVNINAQMAAAEISLDKDWVRYKASFFYASGDNNPRSGTARGFDSIFDDPDFAGGIFSFWNREGIHLLGTGVSLQNPDSLVPDLRTSKLQGQANFVNPGIFIYNAGANIDVTPKLRAFLNLNLIWFADTEPLELLLFQSHIANGVGADSGLGIRYRPPLTDNIILTAGINAFQPFQGFTDMFTGRLLWAGFVNVRVAF